MRRNKWNQKKIYDWINTREDMKWRRTYLIDAKRVSYFINHGLDSTLPKSLSRKSEDYSYSRAKNLAKQFLDEQEEKQVQESRIRKFVKKVIREKTTLDKVYDLEFIEVFDYITNEEIANYELMNGVWVGSDFTQDSENDDILDLGDSYYVSDEFKTKELIAMFEDWVKEYRNIKFVFNSYNIKELKRELLKMYENKTNIKKSELRKMIREEIQSLGESSNSDPTYKEMVNYLEKKFRLEFDEFNVNVAIYWFAYDYHSGMNSNVYQSIPQTQYKPSRILNNINDEDDYIAKEMYDELVNKFA